MLRWNFTSFASFARNFVKRSAMVSSSAKEGLSPKVGMFLQLLEQLQAAKAEQVEEVDLPMDRSDIGEYTGINSAAVSRAFRRLIARGIIKVRNRRHVTITDRNAFDKIAGHPIEPGHDMSNR